jgi:hypothetical protein
MKKTNIKNSLNALQLSDIYSLMFFLLYKIQDVPEYATLSEICYLLDGNNLLRLLAYFAGKTITIPTEEELVILIDALLLYQYININGENFVQAQNKITNVTAKQRDKITELYLKIIPIINQYNIDRSQIHKYAR